MNNSEVTIFKTEDGETEIQVKLKKDTVWLSLIQLTELFQRDKSVISRHINNIFKEKELEKPAIVANFATVQLEGGREVERNIEFFNLDLIISIGYRIKSQRGTQFRIWVNKVLKDFLNKGYSLNAHKLIKQNEQLRELQKSVKLNFSYWKLQLTTAYFFSSQLTPSLPSLMSNPMAVSSLRILSEVTQSLFVFASARSFISKATTSLRTSLFPVSA